MQNQDRIDNIINTLAAKGPMSESALRSWLGYPYRFEQNVAELIETGNIKRDLNSRGRMVLDFIRL